jgi:hypothetical protein
MRFPQANSGKFTLNIRRAVKFFLVLSLGAALVGCASKKPIGYSDFDTETDFSNFHSFAWISRNPLFVASADAVNPALEGVLMEEVKSNLTRHGFQYVADPEEADFVVGFTVGGRDTMHTTVYSQSYRSSYRTGGWTATRIGVFDQDSTQAGIVIDIFDQAKAEKKWMGWAIQELTMNDRRFLRETVRDLVKIILANFPPS